MIYTKVLIAGANSYLASQCVSKLELDSSEIFLVSRESISMNYSFKGSRLQSLIVKDYEDKEVLDTLVNFLGLSKEDNLLIINFIGSFGTIKSIDELNLEHFDFELGQNLFPFMVFSKLIARCDKGLFLSFAGAGIGGENLELSSLSYLASKASMVVLVEALDRILQENGVRVGAISPGAFPSRMQRLVAESQDTRAVSTERKSSAMATLDQQADSTKLISMLNFLIANPGAAGGRVWSANFDPPEAKLTVKNFGKLRRVY